MTKENEPAHPWAWPLANPYKGLLGAGPSFKWD